MKTLSDLFLRTTEEDKAEFYDKIISSAIDKQNQLLEETKMHNKTLADKQGLTEETRAAIDEIHGQIDFLMGRSSLGVFHQAVYDKIEELEFQLQDLWGFSQDEAYHTHKHRYAFKAQWCGTQWECLTTGEKFVIPETVEERDFYSWGEAYVDVGRYGCYSRFSNCKEVQVPVVNVGGEE